MIQPGKRVPQESQHVATSDVLKSGLHRLLIAFYTKERHTMSDLLIVLCEDCWTKRNGSRKPQKAPTETHSPCDECGKETNSGIYVATTKTPDLSS